VTPPDSLAPLARPRASSWGRRVRRGSTLSAAATAAALALTGFSLGAGATTPAKTTFRLSGAATGALTAPDKKCQGLDKSFSFDDPGVGGSQGNAWTVFVTTPTPRGTWKKFGASSVDQTKLGVQLQDQSTDGSTEWITQSGTITTANGSGHINVTLGMETVYNKPPGAPRVHLSGSWSCTKSG
jgi:hypothetical protein